MRTEKRKNIRNNEEDEELAQQKSGRNAAAALRQSWGFLKDVDVAQKKRNWLWKKEPVTN